jgi:hypothetical protein
MKFERDTCPTCGLPVYGIMHTAPLVLPVVTDEDGDWEVADRGFDDCPYGAAEEKGIGDYVVLCCENGHEWPTLHRDSGPKSVSMQDAIKALTDAPFEDIKEAVALLRDTAYWVINPSYVQPRAELRTLGGDHLLMVYTEDIPEGYVRTKWSRNGQQPLEEWHRPGPGTNRRRFLQDIHRSCSRYVHIINTIPPEFMEEFSAAG